MVDIRHKHLSDKFRFFENFENIHCARNDYRWRQTDYHYNYNLNTLLRQLTVDIKISRAVADCIKARAISDDRNSFHNPLLALSMIHFAKHNGMELTEEEQLAVYLQHSVYDITLGHIDNIRASCDFIESLLIKYYPITTVIQLITDVNTTFTPTSVSSQRICDLNNSVYAYPYKSFVQTQLCQYIEYCYRNGLKIQKTLSKTDPNFCLFMVERNKNTDTEFKKPNGLFYSLELKRLEKRAENNEDKFRIEYM